MARLLKKGRWLIVYKGPYFASRMGPHFCYAEKNGGSVLKGETSPSKINGVWLNTRWLHVWFIFRRNPYG